ncbi:HmuY family protein [Dysgonomonas macrotermitis]|uniref:HmuY protein n=1 Tax=Dysgonomonas macrotermitis TaxID=1346286 RepID=A0A1M5IB23_9BACT|nr:HmuY family protein [Dysgonomonas macrotermitis]SHG25496.1 HmuY protein [Dysgonomonas macrotermitis]
MKKYLYLSLMFAGLFVTSCSDDDPPLPDNTINFSATELGISETESNKSFTLNIDRAESSDIAVSIGINTNGIDYGDDITTTPAATDNTINVTIPAGSTSATIMVTKVAELFDGDESISFDIKSVSGGLVLGDKKSLKLTFSAIVSEGASLTLNGGEGGASAVNSVYVDFSSNEQTSVARNSWNLGFYNGSEFGVILNNVLPATATATDLTVDAVISEADETAYKTELSLNYTDKFAYIDDLSGEISGTIIKEGKVYLVNFAEQTPQLYKVKVSQKDANTYTLQYAASNSSTVNSLDIPKDAKYNFTYASFVDNKIVQVEPEKEKWDIQWTRAVYHAQGIPYVFADMVFINNRAGITAASVEITSTLNYTNVSVTDAANAAFSSDVDVIGSNWRATTGNNAGVTQTHFYLVKDAAGNIYKLRFLKLGVGSDGGTRGYPQIEYALVK